jgi:hypothetical protein
VYVVERSRPRTFDLLGVGFLDRGTQRRRRILCHDEDPQPQLPERQLVAVQVAQVMP